MASIDIELLRTQGKRLGILALSEIAAKKVAAGGLPIVPELCLAGKRPYCIHGHLCNHDKQYMEMCEL